MDALDKIDSDSSETQSVTRSLKKKKLGQYFTPHNIADFMARMFSRTELADGSQMSLLDPGAGSGALSKAVFQIWLSGQYGKCDLHITAYEIDSSLIQGLEKELQHLKVLAADLGRTFSFDLKVTDFILDMDPLIQMKNGTGFTHTILNPPYKKISQGSKHRKVIEAAGIPTVNLYTAFWAKAILELEEQGQCVAIVPRSFCNGPYYKPFRKFLIERTSLEWFHLFESRDKAFAHDEVLQENVILFVRKAKQSDRVRISTSFDGEFTDVHSFDISFSQIVFEDDPQLFIHIPTSDEPDPVRRSTQITCSLEDLDLEVSTGPVVDFRVRPEISDEDDGASAPLIHPGHFRNREVRWPNFELKKPNYIKVNDSTRKWLYPNGTYVVLRRFSSKEEKRRLVACVSRSEAFDTDVVGFENHVNVIHSGKQGIDPNLAYGLMAFLNSSFADNYFRRFNGHTQVNATDLRSMVYPPKEALTTLGTWVRANWSELNNTLIDEQVEKTL